METTELLERDHVLDALERGLDAARAGAGRVVVVAGPAGIGKSTVVDRFLDRHHPVRQITGRCDDLSIPRAFGPFADAAARDQLDRAALETADSLASELLAAVSRTTTIIAIDDIHWADQGTADIVTLLGRRIHELPCLLIVTMRDDPGPTTARPALGSLPAGITERHVLQPLSPGSLAALVPPGSEADPDEIHRVTGGNPFLAIELLRSRGGISGSIRDRYAAAVDALSPSGRLVAHLLAVSPDGCTWVVLDRVLDECHAAVDELERAGLAESTASGVRFRHELARRAVEAGLSGAVRRRCHVELLTQLVAVGGDPAVIAHHAAAVDDVALLVSSSIDAARRSADAGAHVDALHHIERVLPHDGVLGDVDRSHLYEVAMLEYQMNLRLDEALAMAERRIELPAVRADPTALSAAYRAASRVLWAMARADESREFLHRSAEVLERDVSSAELARRYVDVAMDLAMRSQWREAEEWAARALDHADEQTDPQAFAQALGTSELVLSVVGDVDDARRHGDRAISIFRREGCHRDLVVTLQNRAATALNTLRLDECANAIAAARAALDRDDSLASSGWLDGLVARYALHTGRWDEAERRADEALRANPYGLHRAGPLIVRTLLRVRRGDGAGGLDEAVALVARLGDIQRVGQVAAATAEVSWLGGGFDADLFERAVDLAGTSGHPRFVAELAVWRRRRGEGRPVPLADGPEPLRAELEGRWEDAADAWEALGCPYERALALAFSGDHGAMQEAAQSARTLGATTTADRIRQMLRDEGVTVARGPRATTRSNPAGLTNRQVEVAELLVEGLSNAEIADRLFVSPKTVDHHVSAVLVKLGASNRREAGAVFADLKRRQTPDRS